MAKYKKKLTHDSLNAVTLAKKSDTIFNPSGQILFNKNVERTSS